MLPILANMATPLAPLADKPSSPPAASGLPLFAAALSAALVGAALAYVLHPQLAAMSAADAAAHRPRVVTSAITALKSTDEPAALVDVPAAASWLQPPLAGMPLASVAELQELQASLAQGRTADLPAMAEQMLFDDTTRLFAALAAQPGDTAELRAAAGLLTELLQARAQRGELAPEVSDAMQSQVQSLLQQALLDAPAGPR